MSSPLWDGFLYLPRWQKNCNASSFALERVQNAGGCLLVLIRGPPGMMRVADELHIGLGHCLISPQFMCPNEVQQRWRDRFFLHLWTGMNNYILSRTKNNQAQSLSNLCLWTVSCSCSDSRKAIAYIIALEEDGLNSFSSTSIITSWTWNSQPSFGTLFRAIICL